MKQLSHWFWRKIFSSDKVKFLVVHGDITTKDNISAKTAVEKIYKLICSESKKYGYAKTNIKRIIHITDTDGAFVPDTALKVAKEDKKYEGSYVTKEDKLFYYTDHMTCRSIEKMKSRNKQKSEVMYRLSTTNYINRIPYKIYYMSCNMEHVFHNELKDFSDDEKREMAHNFAEKYILCPHNFIDFISRSDFTVEGSYKETWTHIQQGLNSLNRYSNFHLAFMNEEGNS